MSIEQKLEEQQKEMNLMPTDNMRKFISFIAPTEHDESKDDSCKQCTHSSESIAPSCDTEREKAKKFQEYEERLK